MIPTPLPFSDIIVTWIFFVNNGLFIRFSFASVIQAVPQLLLRKTGALALHLVMAIIEIVADTADRTVVMTGAQIPK